MVLDTSAIVAAIAREPDVLRFENAMVGATSLEMSAVSVLESKIVLHSRHGKPADAGRCCCVAEKSCYNNT